MTPGELSILDYAREMIAVGGLSPTVRGCAAHAGVSVQAAHAMISRLVDDGLLKRRPRKRYGLSLPGADVRGVPTEQLRAELARRGVTMEALTARADRAARAEDLRGGQLPGAGADRHADVPDALVRAAVRPAARDQGSVRRARCRAVRDGGHEGARPDRRVRGRAVSWELGPRDDGHGVTRREKAILDRREAGAEYAEIAAELGLSENYVRKVVWLYPISDAGHRAWCAAAAASDAAFLAAVARTGKSFA